MHHCESLIGRRPLAVGILKPLITAENATLPLELLTRDKTDKNKANYAKCVTALKSKATAAAASMPLTSQLLLA